jgi:hypothetical protein
MIALDADSYAQRLYARIPAHYRAYDAEQDPPMPLYALLRVVAAQVASVRQDLDDLWDNFFIETCADWVVPYIGALLGTNMLAHPVGQSSRLDVWNTILWRRSKGTPAMLRALAGAISGWPVDLAEFFRTLGWSQNLNSLRAERLLTPDLRGPYRLSLLGTAADPFAHAADFKPAHALDESRALAGGVGVGCAAWGTPGRYQIQNVGFFAPTLQTFALAGVTPTSCAPGDAPKDAATAFTFDPLFTNVPLFAKDTAVPITRPAFADAPWDYFGEDKSICVRQFGVPFAAADPPAPSMTSSDQPFRFGGAPAPLQLHKTAGLRLMDRAAFQLGGTHFIITATWIEQDGGDTTLGKLSTLLASRRASATLDGAEAYQRSNDATRGAGQLAIVVACGSPTPEWPAPELFDSPPGRFPGAVLAVRLENLGAWRSADALYVYIPPVYVTPDTPATFLVADDGSIYLESAATLNAPLLPEALARASEGQVYPSYPAAPSVGAELDFAMLNRSPGGVRIGDRGRLGSAPAGALFEVGIFTGIFQPLGAVASLRLNPGDYPQFTFPPGATTWPAFTYVASNAPYVTSDALSDQLPGPLSVRITLLQGTTFVPRTDLVVTGRSGTTLLVYLPETTTNDATPRLLFVADDGSTYDAPGDDAQLQALATAKSYPDLVLAQASAGQALAVPGVWPIQHRQPVALDLCSWDRQQLLWPGELGIDPERGRFALRPDDPAVADALSQEDRVLPPCGLSGDYYEAFADCIGARACAACSDASQAPSRLVARSGDALSESAGKLADAAHPVPVYATLADALGAAMDGDIIEIADSGTYPAEAEVALPADPSIQHLTMRAAAGQRPCLTFYTALATPTARSLHVTQAMASLSLCGLLMSGGPITVDKPVDQVTLTACTLDPRFAGTSGSLVATDSSHNDQTDYLLCRCITGGLYTAAGVSRLTLADSIVDARGRLAIGGAPPQAGTTLSAQAAAQTLHLERVTVLGSVHCEILSASDCLFDDVVLADDQQSGCIRFSRYELGSALPPRYQCIPTVDQAQACQAGGPQARCLAPLFNSRRFGRPDYAQLAPGCPPALLTAGEQGAEVGAFAGRLNAIRVENLDIKLREFLPVSMVAVLVGTT